MRQDRSAKPEIVSVTSAGLSHSADIALRQRRYVLMQSLRIVCIVLATALPVALPYKGLLILGAVALPWFGVVMANAGPTVGKNKAPRSVEPRVEPQPERVAITSTRVIDAD